MREIKFRGMSVNGEWHYGLLSEVKKEYPHDNIEVGFYISNRAGMPFAYHIRPETVGQYIGFRDKNEMEIYEDDNLRLGNSIKRVKWQEGNRGHGAGWNIANGKNQEVIGNVHK